MNTVNNHARFIAPSKFELSGLARKIAKEAIKEGEELREKLSGRRILEVSGAKEAA